MKCARGLAKWKRVYVGCLRIRMVGLRCQSGRPKAVGMVGVLVAAARDTASRWATARGNDRRTDVGGVPPGCRTHVWDPFRGIACTTVRVLLHGLYACLCHLGYFSPLPSHGSQASDQLHALHRML